MPDSGANDIFRDDWGDLTRSNLKMFQLAIDNGEWGQQNTVIQERNRVLEITRKAMEATSGWLLGLEKWARFAVGGSLNRGGRGKEKTILKRKERLKIKLLWIWG